MDEQSELPAATESDPVPRRRPTGRLMVGIGLCLLAVVLFGSLMAAGGPRSGVKPRAVPASLPGAASMTSTTLAPTALTSVGMTARWVADENAKQGTPYWNLTTAQSDHSIEGYANRVSAQRGDNVTLYVSTEAPTFHVEAYRMGFYGGKGARLVWKSDEVPGQRQPAAEVSPGINMVEAHWKPSITLTVGDQWPPGVYLLKLFGSGSQQQYVPLTVRDDASTAAYVIQNSVTTWQAYNMWGGFDLYQGGPARSFADRSRVVSFDRPYAMGFGNGAADLIGNELPFIMKAEELGLDVTYWTDVDLHEHPELLQHHRALISLGHDEYWSTAMRDGAETARDEGINLMFLGANAVFRHIRFDPSPLGGDRHEIDFKDARSDPLFGKNNAEVTVNWREAPVSRPESTLIGDYYECNPVKADLVVFEADSWILAGTGATNKTAVPGLVGSEYDRYQPGEHAPANLEVIAHSPLTCRGKPSYSDVTYYSAPGGGAVFATGTNWWVSRIEDPFVARVTENVLAAFGAGPAGHDHPSHDNIGTVPEAPAAPPPPE